MMERSIQNSCHVIKFSINSGGMREIDEDFGKIDKNLEESVLKYSEFS